MKRFALLVAGIVSYLLFLLAALYAVSFTLRGLMPNPIAVPHATPVLALSIDVGFILIFGLQHSIMARSGWKARWTTLVPPTVERSLYVLIASCILLAMFWCWQPISGAIWTIAYPLERIIVYGVCVVGWGIILWSTFQIDHFELFGLRQVWRAVHNQAQPSAEFRKPILYRFVRHPMMAGFLLAFWATPTMTIDRLVLALGMTVYILIGLVFEERALLRQFGPTYERYQMETPQLIPVPRKLYGAFQTKPKYTHSRSVSGE